MARPLTRLPPPFKGTAKKRLFSGFPYRITEESVLATEYRLPTQTEHLQQTNHNLIVGQKKNVNEFFLSNSSW